MRRRSLVLFVIMALVLSFTLGQVALTAPAQAAGISVVVNGKSLAMDTPPLLEQGRVLVPMRGIFEALGATVKWDPQTKTVTASKGGVRVVLKIGAKTASVGNKTTTLEVPARLVKARTLVPLRFVSEAFGASVNWNATAKKVTVNSTGGQAAKPPVPKDPDVILATTTSTYDTGLLDALIPVFKSKTGYKVKPIAVGTGEALAMGQRGDADVLLVHAPSSEKPLVDAGIGINYKLVMHNDFVLVGPASDPAGIKAAKTAAEAMAKIAAAKATFVSRGDESGTHKKEKELWAKAKITPGGSWYVQAGSGMAQTLAIASERGAYTLTDRGTYLATRKNLHLNVLLEGDSTLLNIYHVMQVNPAKFPGTYINADGAKAFVDFLVSPEGQRIIGNFGVDKYGQPLFFPDAGKD